MIALKDPYGFDDSDETKDNRKVKVGKVFSKVDKYNFGDGGMHKIECMEQSE